MITPGDPRHGERRGYVAGCRDGCCLAAHNQYLREQRKLNGDTHLRAQKRGRIRRERAREAGQDRFVFPAEPVREYMKQLTDLHWSTSALAAMHGSIDGATISQLIRSDSTLVESKTHRLLELPRTLRVADVVPGGAWVPSLGARRRLEAMFAVGWTYKLLQAEMQRLLGVNHFLGVTDSQINADRWRRIDAVYRSIGMQPGPSWKNRQRAEPNGWIARAAWDDIDDPDERPVMRPAVEFEPFDEVAVRRRMGGDMTVYLGRAGSVEVVRRLLAEGKSTWWIAKYTGLQPSRYAHVTVEGAARAAQKGKAA